MSHLFDDIGEHVGHARAVYSVAFSPNGHFVATASADRTVKVALRQELKPSTAWDHMPRSPAPPCRWRLYRARISPHPRLDGYPPSQLWSFETKHVLHTFHGHEQWVQSVAFVCC